jgi:hypothetical protein
MRAWFQLESGRLLLWMRGEYGRAGLSIDLGFVAVMASDEMIFCGRAPEIGGGGHRDWREEICFDPCFEAGSGDGFDDTLEMIEALAGVSELCAGGERRK